MDPVVEAKKYLDLKVGKDPVCKSSRVSEII